MAQLAADLAAASSAQTIGKHKGYRLYSEHKGYNIDALLHCCMLAAKPLLLTAQLESDFSEALNVHCMQVRPTPRSMVSCKYVLRPDQLRKHTS
jgi:hypothetical protein